MKKTYMLLALTLAACSGNNKTTGTTQPADTTTQASDTTSAQAPHEWTFTITADPALLDNKTVSIKNAMLHFFGRQNAIALLSVNQSLKEAVTDEELHTCYRYLDSVCQTTTRNYMNREDDPLEFYAHIDSLNDIYGTRVAPALKYVTFTCEAECSMPRILPNYGMLAETAAKTIGKQDDEFFRFLKTVFPSSGSDSPLMAVWFDMNWDYGGNSLLGAGHHYTVLRLAQDIKRNNVFAEEIKRVEALCLEDALNWNTLYYTAEKAIAELKKIMQLETGAASKKQIQERIKKLQSPGEDIQVDCEHKKCAYG